MKRWSGFVGRSVYFWLIGWPVLAAVVWIGAPRIPTLLEDDETGFLPQSVQSQQAYTILQKEFPDYAPASRAMVVAAHEPALTPADHTYLAGVAGQLANQQKAMRWRVRSASRTPFLRPLLESSDGKAALIAIDLPAPMLTHHSVKRVRAIQQILKQLPPPPGLSVEVTGGAALGELLDANTKRDVDRTTAFAFVAITAILLLIYRSPVAVLLPVVTIGVSLTLTLGLLGRAAAAGWPINGLVEMFIIVIVAGSSTDYCLFLFDRFREQCAAGCDGPTAVWSALTSTGGAILASAGTNAVALATLAIALNRDLYTSGPTIAMAIVIAAFCVMTLTPSLMWLVGHKLFWPADVDRHSAQQGDRWHLVAQAVTRRPGLVACTLITLLLPFAWLGIQSRPLYDDLDEYPPTSSFVRGARLYEKHFWEGRPVSDQSVIVHIHDQDTSSWDKTISRANLERITSALRLQLDVAYVRHLHDPLGSHYADSSDHAYPSTSLTDAILSKMAKGYFVGQSGRSWRMDVGIVAEPRSRKALDAVETIRQIVRQTLAKDFHNSPTGAEAFSVYVAGEPATYADIRAVRTRDFRWIATLAIALVYLILLWLLRSPIESAILVAATLLTYLATYGGCWLLFREFFGVESLSYQIDFLLFIVVLSLGQDYNIYVVTRIHEERTSHNAAEAIGIAIARTGRVVSSCGLIMAAAFGSMYAGSLLLMKEFAVALAMGILLDTFLVRPLLVPALLLLLAKRRELQ